MKQASQGLTRNQQLVFDLLEENRQPLSAYAILDALRKDGLKAPPQVYRALEHLMEAGKVHRLESLNAFLACRHPACDNHSLVTFGICETCGRVEEFSDDGIMPVLTAVAAPKKFQVKSGFVEIRGVCARCAEQA